MVLKQDIIGLMMITNLFVSYRFSKRKKDCECSPLRSRYQGQALRVCFEKIFPLVSAVNQFRTKTSSYRISTASRMHFIGIRIVVFCILSEFRYFYCLCINDIGKWTTSEQEVSPELQRIRNKRGYIESLISAILEKDIKRRFKIRNVDALRKIANHLINNACQEINYGDMSGILREPCRIYS